ncbi:MAG: S8 family serine peptidase [Ignavibacteriales bacterium]|nr:S8 family serine peptidase [Ignavibacteriales bacterium]
MNTKIIYCYLIIINSILLLGQGNYRFLGGESDGFSKKRGYEVKTFSIQNRNVSLIQPNLHLNFPLNNSNEKQPEKYELNKVVVKLKENVKVFQGQNKTSSESVNLISEKYSIQAISSVLKNNSMVVDLSVEADVEALVREYNKNPDVEYAHPDYFVYLNGEINNAPQSGIKYRQNVPNDSLFKYQWYLNNTGQFKGTRGIDVDMLWGWNLEDTGDTVAILDTRIFRNHPNLPQNRLLNEIDCIGENSIDLPYHGLATALIIAGEKDNGIGISGIAPNTIILPVRVLNDYGVGTHSTLAQGIYEAVDAGIKIINMSLGSYAYSNTLKDAIEYAHSKGAILICASGNDNNNNHIKFHFPSDFKECISVGAMDNLGYKSKSSNYGGIDFLAPGENIVFDEVDGELVILEGTSSSSAIVTGIVSLIKSKNPNLTNDEIRAVLQITSNDIGNKGYDDTTGYGMVNAYQSLLSASENEICKAFIVCNETDSLLHVEILDYDVNFEIKGEDTEFYVFSGEIYPVIISTLNYNSQGIVSLKTNNIIKMYDTVFVSSFENSYNESSILVITDSVYIPKSISGIIEVEVGNIGSGEIYWMASVDSKDTSWIKLHNSRGQARDTIVIQYSASDSVNRIGKIYVFEETSNTSKSVFIAQRNILYIARDTLFVDSLVAINWEIGKVKRIKHRGGIFSEQGQPVSMIKLEYTINADSSSPEWFSITGADSLPVDLGEFTWRIPKTPTDYCKVRISDAVNKYIIEVTDSIFVIDTTIPTDIKYGSFTPKEYCLYQNYPNPFNPTTNIKFDLPINSVVNLKVYDILGQEVITILNKELSAGYHNYKWDATNFSSGVYIIRLEATPVDRSINNYISIKKVVLLK